MLEIKNITISYQDRPTVKDFSMSLKEGKIASLVGESGSGKTTVIRAVLGMYLWSISVPMRTQTKKKPGEKAWKCWSVCVFQAATIL